MEKSESIVELSKALCEFHKAVGKIKKENTNPFFKSKYADLSTILDVIDKPLIDSGLSIIQLPTNENELETILIHISGEFISSTYKMTPTKNDPQSLGSAITYQRRYALGAILSLNIDNDDDGNNASTPATQPQPQPELPWLNVTDIAFVESVKWLKGNPANKIETIKKKYRISKQTELEMIKEAKK